ncbi:peptidoglycan recognition protein family protein [Bradyrhizobium sp. 521_C7_N1_3]|uniref:peptidoglycan recognition protein family protein n=1 Tax=Bradyrhizobium sp. 521_C7_N1_3 TaxID=3240368 RepID=UPI003F8B041D
MTKHLTAVVYLFAICTQAAAQTAADPTQAIGTPDIPGLNIVWLAPWGRPELARPWRNIIVHQSEGPPGSAQRMALKQMETPDRRGATVWVETDGTVYWSVVEFAAPKHVRGNRDDSKYIDNRATFHQIDNADSIAVEFVGNYPNVRRPVTQAQADAWLILAKVLLARYSIPAENIYAHAWVDYKDRRYCEGCELAALARAGRKILGSRLARAHSGGPSPESLR